MSLEAIYEELRKVEARVSTFVGEHAGLLSRVHPSYRASAENLLVYVGLRQLDLRDLQQKLSEWGLSSLGRCEGHVRSSLSELHARLEDALHLTRAPVGSNQGAVSRVQARRLLRQHTQALLGEHPPERHVLIMVTAPDEPPSEEECAALLQSGLNVLRINTAHGSLQEWQETAARIRQVAARLARKIWVEVDLQGPKVRTAAIEPGPAVMRFRPPKDQLGRVTCALRVPIVGASESELELGQPALRVPDSWVRKMRREDEIATRDSRDRPRVFRISEVAPRCAVGELERTCYLTPDCELVWRRHGEVLGRCHPHGIEPLEGFLTLSAGDEVHLLLDGSQCQPGMRNPLDARSWSIVPRLGLLLGECSLTLAPRQRVLIDDGQVEVVVDQVEGNLVRGRVSKAARTNVKIRCEKGVNFPDSVVSGPALSSGDREILPEVLRFADVLGLSFVRTAADVRRAREEIERAAGGGAMPGIVVKIETAQALSSLPEVLLEALVQFPVGIMIARGDLAAEVGFGRLAEVQQEILWFAEAAHLPVIWATQVLDTLARTGIPSRAEVTDASMSVQAECVMLNKGPFVAEACRTLDAILHSMEAHQYKKQSLYRPLKISKLPLVQESAV